MEKILSGYCWLVSMLKPITVRAKIVFLGDGAVGKTSIAKRYLGEGFKGNYKATIGADFYVKKEVYEFPKLGRAHFIWQIFDIAGQPTFGSIRPVYYRGAKGAIVVFDVSRAETFYNVKNWIEEFWKNAGVYPFILVGNKVDLRGIKPGCLPPEAGKRYAESLSKVLGFPVQYVETSAKTGYNINYAFKVLAWTLLVWFIHIRRRMSQK